MKSVSDRKQSGWSVHTLVGIVVLAGLTGCGTLQGGSSQPLVSYSQSTSSSGLQKWDVNKLQARKKYNPMKPAVQTRTSSTFYVSKKKLTPVDSQPSAYEKYFELAKQEYLATQTQVKKFIAAKFSD